ncbi:MAG: hypothetical protein GX575_11380 [Candidatus Anammoximicrobium sp.]|nr:hypothetical protein [Candidatus Anammoximicrobium sp.]
MNVDVKKIAARGQTETTEVRGARTPVESLAKVICGMLNQQGGTIVVGVADGGQKQVQKDRIAREPGGVFMEEPPIYPGDGPFSTPIVLQPPPGPRFPAETGSLFGAGPSRSSCACLSAGRGRRS